MIVVTGGAGFIGSNIVAGLQDSGRTDLVVIDQLGKDEKWRNLAKRELRAIIQPKDMMTYLNEHVSEIEMVIHMGAISSTTETDADLIVQTNFEMTMRLWQFSAVHGKRFIYASSAATYGAGENGFEDDASLEYLNALRPLNAYGWSKALVDRAIAREITEKRAAPIQHVGLKFFNVYGPNEYHKGGQKSVVAHIYPLVAADKEVQLFKSYNPEYADGAQKRDFVWVGDIVSVVLWLMDHPTISGLFNVGSGEARTFHDLAVAVWRATARPPKIAYREMPIELREKYQYFTKANLARLREVGYDRPMTSLEDGIKEYVSKYLSCSKDPYR